MQRTFYAFGLVGWLACWFLALQCPMVLAQKPTNVAKLEARFKVYGNCGACEERIAEALDQKGIIAGTWDRVKQEVWVVYRPSKVSLEQIHRYIAGAGHDTDLLQADSAVYNALPNCCLYREKHSPH